jgi:alkylation response protein AidB-like acyl-CoA dehydrogenase
MDLSLDQPYADFRDELRAFLAQHGNTAPPGVTIRDRGAPSAELLAWQKTLIAHGYAARNIPKEYGGFGAPWIFWKTRSWARSLARRTSPADWPVSAL